MLFDTLLFALGILTGAIASVAGFGIGSFLTAVVALRVNFNVAVAAVGIAHLLGLSVRLWLLRSAINRRVLASFGLVSAVGSLAGALLQGYASNTTLTVIFGGLMVLAGISGLLRWTEKVRLSGGASLTAGALSGFFGGLVGNQGGMRAVGLLGLDLKKVEFVATATAVALVVDICRTPIYVASYPTELSALGSEIAIMSTGVVIGTIIGAPILRRLPERAFRVILSVLIIVVGLLIAFRR